VRNGNVSFYQLVGVGIRVEEACPLRLDVPRLPVYRHILTDGVLLSIDSGKEDIELEIAATRCDSDFDNRIRLLLVPAAVPQDDLLDYLALVCLGAHQAMVIWPGVLILGLKHVETATGHPLAVIGLIVPEIKVEVPRGQGLVGLRRGASLEVEADTSPITAGKGEGLPGRGGDLDFVLRAQLAILIHVQIHRIHQLGVLLLLFPAYLRLGGVLGCLLGGRCGGRSCRWDIGDDVWLLAWVGRSLQNVEAEGVPPGVEGICRLVGDEEQLLLEGRDGPEDVDVAL
jgi:hypothetical protein